MEIHVRQVFHMSITVCEQDEKLVSGAWFHSHIHCTFYTNFLAQCTVYIIFLISLCSFLKLNKPEVFL